MAMGPRLDLRQSQSLVMTPQLRQAIKLLQFSNLEVSAFVEEELERNPLLERADEADLPRAGTPAPGPGAIRSTDAEIADAADHTRSETLPEGCRAAARLRLRPNIYDSGPPTAPRRGRGGNRISMPMRAASRTSRTAALAARASRRAAAPVVSPTRSTA